MWRVGGGGGVVSSRVHAIDPGRYQLPTLYPVTLALTPSLWPGNALSLDMISLLYLFVHIPSFQNYPRKQYGQRGKLAC